MSNSARFGNKWKLTTIILIVALAISCFVTLYQADVLPKTGVVAAQPSFIDVTVSGARTKLGVNDPETYTATIASDHSGSMTYTWSITPNDNKTKLTPNLDKCTLEFIAATEEAYSLSCTVKDEVYGNQGSGSLAVYDPYTSPNLYLGAYGAPYSYLIETDGLGWYRAINGQTGAVSWSSTNLLTPINSALGDNRKVVIMGGSSEYVWTGGYIYVNGYENLTIEGVSNPVLKRNENGVLLYGANGCSNIVISGLTLVGTGNSLHTDNRGIEFGGSVQNSEIRIIKNTVKDFGYDGILFLDNVVNSIICENIVSGCGDDGINIGGGAVAPVIGVTVSDNICFDMLEGAGVHVSVNSQDTSVTGNIITNCYDGVGLAAASAVTVTANSIRACGVGVIGWSISNNSVITNNIIDGTIDTAASNEGILLSGFDDWISEDTLINGNLIRNTFNEGVRCLYADNVTITNNIFYNNSGSCIFTQASSNIIINENKLANSTYAIQVSGGNAIEANENLIQNVGSKSIYFANSERVSANGNLVNNSKTTGIEFYVCTHVVANENLICNSGTNLDGIGLYVYGSSNLNIQGNIIFDTRTSKQQIYGIQCNTVNDAIILGNDVEDNRWSSIVFTASTNLIVAHNDGYVTENIVAQTNSTATTFAITTGLAGNVTFASYMFDATTLAISDFKVVSGVQTSPTVWTVTVSGTGLPASMTCTASFEYKP